VEQSLNSAEELDQNISAERQQG